MKATGIVRRIDDLGRIVIPKEIRKTLKVKEGMPLEIYTDKEGGIILRKFLPFSEMSSLSEEFAQCVAQQMGNAVFVTDREKVVAAAGYTGEDIVGEPISHILENILDDRDERLPLSERNRFIPVIHGMEEHEQICQAIRSNGQIIGAIIIQAKDRKQRLGGYGYKDSVCQILCIGLSKDFNRSVSEWSLLLSKCKRTGGLSELP